MNAPTTPESVRPPHAEAYLPGRNPFTAVKFLRRQRRLEPPDRSGTGQSMSALEALFALHVRAAKLPEPEREYRFDPIRR